MPEVYYVIPMVAGPYSRANPQRPDYVDAIQCNWTGHNVDLFGVYVCLVNTTAAKHTDLASRAGVYQLPTAYTWDTVISTMQAAARNYIRNLCENRLGIAYSTAETLGELLMRVINSGLFDLGATDPATQFQNLSAAQQNKIIALFAKWGMTLPAQTETVQQISDRGGAMYWPGNDRSKVYVEEF
jgi:hypothetical protein